MEQLILHLIGDYITQTDKMARFKVKDITWAFIHAIIYSIPFALFLTNSDKAIAVICLSHVVIDRYRWARRIIFFKNKITDWSLKWVDCCDTGYQNNMNPLLGVVLMIVTDNALHLTINYLALRYL